MLNHPLPLGATPIHDSSGLRLHWVKTRAQLNEAEADSILKAASKYFSQRKFPAKWFDDWTLRKIHREMFESVWGWAGIYYLGPLRNIGIQSQFIPIQVRELCRNVLFWLEQKTDLTFLEQSVRIHFRLAQIHPFTNGNGRHARLIADLYLHSLFGFKPNWPEKIFDANSNLRTGYIESLKQADRGDYSLLTSLTLKYGGRNPSITDVLTLSFFKQHFSSPKLTETMQNLLRFGSQVDELSQEGHHPLQLAIRKNFSEIAKLLISRGANIRQKDKSGLTPLEWALKNENQELATLLK